MPGTISVHVVLTDLNGQSSDVRVTQEPLGGAVIPSEVGKIAGEAAGLAVFALALDDTPIHRDRAGKR